MREAIFFAYQLGMLKLKALKIRHKKKELSFDNSFVAGTGLEPVTFGL